MEKIVEKNVESLIHTPVMLNEIIGFVPSKYGVFIDGTLWHGGHSNWILSKFDWVELVWIDKDIGMIKKAKNVLAQYKNKKQYFEMSYSKIWEIVNSLWWRKIDYLLLDLWVNMEHFKDASRGFSIKSDWPLDMRYDRSGGMSAKQLIWKYSEYKITNMLQQWGDFSQWYAKKIATTINKYIKNIDTTQQLTDVLKDIGMNSRKIAVVFQCIRIEVNNELEDLTQFLNIFWEYLSSWGRCTIITYHSIEDRMVKLKFKEMAENGFSILTKKVIKPNWIEIKKNRASKSAKLRVIEKK